MGLFTHNFLLQHPNLQQIEGIFNEGFRKVLNNQLLPIRWATSHRFLFFIGSRSRFHLLIKYILVTSAYKSSLEDATPHTICILTGLLPNHDTHEPESWVS